MRRATAGIALALCLGGGAARAAQVVEFADGRYLEVRSHTVIGDLIRIEVAPGSFLVCPATSVDEIRGERQRIYPQRAATPPDTAAGSPARSFELRQHPSGSPATARNLATSVDS